ncbi:MAG: ribonuclease P protein component [Candidatus Aminicenantales bacterium]
MLETLSPRERITKKKDFSAIYKKGRWYRGYYFHLVCLPNSLAFSRMAVVASKKVGNAVTRSRIKRVIRELFRRNKELLTSPLDIIFIAKKNIQNSDWEKVRDQYFSVIQAISLKK